MGRESDLLYRQIGTMLQVQSYANLIKSPVPANMAVPIRNSYIFGMIIQYMLDSMIIDKEGNTVYHRVAKSGNREVMELIMKQDMADINVCNKHDQNPLHLAASSGRLVICKMLLEKGAEYNKKDKHKQTALYFAAKNNRVDVCNLLLEQKNIATSLNVQNNFGWSPLHIACKKGNIEIVHLLVVQKTIELNKQDTYQNKTPVYLAASNGHAELVALLLRQEKCTADDKNVIAVLKRSANL